MRFIDLWSEFTPNNVPNRALYKLNDPREFNAWMCVPFPLLGSMLHTPMLAFGYLCFTFSTHVVTLTIICSVSFENPNVHNISVSGTTLDQVQKLLDKSDSQVDSENYCFSNTIFL
jgi:hypothetical protein